MTVSKQRYEICVLPGDGIGPEIMRVALEVLHTAGHKHDIEFNCIEAPIGGCAIDACGNALPPETIELARRADAVLLGAVGGPRWDSVDPTAPRPEDGLLGIRKELGLYANLRPVHVYDALLDASPLKPATVRGCDILIVRELTGGLYFGEHVTVENVAGAGANGSAGAHAHDVMRYDEHEIERIAHRAFAAAGKRRGRVTSVDKANVLDTGRLWRRIVHRVAAEYPHVDLTDMLVDNCAMQLVMNPGQFDVILTENTFGDILSDEASVLAGSLGLLASASLGDESSLFEPCHGSAPDIAGKNIANPFGQVLSVAMMLTYGLGLDDAAADVTRAVDRVLEQGWRTVDVAGAETDAVRVLGTREMGERIVACIEEER